MQTPFFLESRISLQHQRISPARHTRLPRPFRARALSTRPILPFFSRTLEIRAHVLSAWCDSAASCALTLPAPPLLLPCAGACAGAFACVAAVRRSGASAEARTTATLRCNIFTPKSKRDVENGMI